MTPLAERTATRFSSKRNKLRARSASLNVTQVAFCGIQNLTT
jgi:hypothetical protein